MSDEFLNYYCDFIIRCYVHAGMSIWIACHDPPEGGSASVSQWVRQEVTEILRRCEFSPYD